MTQSSEYELIVIGTGPAGEKAAVKAAYFGHKVAVVEKEEVFGGAGAVTGTLPSKTLKEAALFYSGKYEHGLYGAERELHHKASVEEFMFRKNYITDWAAREVRENLMRHGVDIYQGIASFEDPHTIRIKGKKEQVIQGNFILIATGSYPFHPPEIPFDGKRVHDSDTILQIKKFPRSLCIVGAGVIGCEYATIFSTMGIQVYLVNNKEKIMPQIDEEVSMELIAQMEANRVEILFNTSVTAIQVPTNPDEMIKISLKTGTVIEADMFLFAAKRCGNIKALELQKAGVQVDERESIQVDKEYRTNIPHIFAVGDAIGFPSLASTSMEQGRVAVSYMFKTNDLENLPSFVPYGIYTIPEVSMAGMTSQEAITAQISYSVGKARYPDMPRGKIIGASAGFLKLVFRKEDLVVLGVHIVGNIATELIHFGVALIEDKKSLYYIIERVFNYPTLHDLYKYAAYDGLSNMAGHKVKN